MLSCSVLINRTAQADAPGSILENQVTGSSFSLIDNSRETRVSLSAMVTTTESGSCTLGGGLSDPSITPYISGEVRRNVAATRDLVDTLDNRWRTAVGQPVDPDLESWFGTASITKGSVNNFEYVDLLTTNSVNVAIELVQIPIESTECIGETTTTGSSPTLSSSRSLQSSAPRPASLYDSSDQSLFWNETRAGSLRDSKRNAVLFSFNQPVTSFGFWVGDLETRTDGNGTPAILRLLDTFGNRIGRDIEIAPTVLFDGNVPDPDIVDQGLCGGTGNNEPGCGNNATRWVSFVDSSARARVQKVMLIVGDDDSAVGNNNGDSEHISFIGANQVSIETGPNVLLVKRITAINGNRTVNLNDNTLLNTIANDNVADSADDNSRWPSDYLLGVINAGITQPGDTIEYTLYFLNAGNGEAVDVRICDWIQPNQQFLPGLYSGNDVTLQLGNGDGSASYTLTAANDVTDRAGLTTVNNLSAAPSCNLSTNANGSDMVLVLDITGTVGAPTGLTTLLGTTGQGRPDNAFGFFRFTTLVNQ